MTKKYRITSSRHDIPREIIDRFEVGGETTESCDQQAIDRFKLLVFEKAHSWDDLDLECVEVTEVSRPVQDSAWLRGQARRLARLTELSTKK